MSSLLVDGRWAAQTEHAQPHQSCRRQHRRPQPSNCCGQSGTARVAGEGWHGPRPAAYAERACRGGGTADARDLKSRDFGRVGSSPTPGTNNSIQVQRKPVSGGLQLPFGARMAARVATHFELPQKL